MAVVPRQFHHNRREHASSSACVGDWPALGLALRSPASHRRRGQSGAHRWRCSPPNRGEGSASGLQPGPCGGMSSRPSRTTSSDAPCDGRHGVFELAGEPLQCEAVGASGQGRDLGTGRRTRSRWPETTGGDRQRGQPWRRSQGPERAADVANVRVVEHRAATRRAQHGGVHSGKGCRVHRDLQWLSNEWVGRVSPTPKSRSPGVRA